MNDLRAAYIPLSGLIFLYSVTEACLWHLQFEDATKHCFAWNAFKDVVMAKIADKRLYSRRDDTRT